MFPDVTGRAGPAAASFVAAASANTNSKRPLMSDNAAKRSSFETTNARAIGSWLTLLTTTPLTRSDFLGWTSCAVPCLGIRQDKQSKITRAAISIERFLGRYILETGPLRTAQHLRSEGR